MSVKMDFEIPSNCRENCKKSRGGGYFFVASSSTAVANIKLYKMKIWLEKKPENLLNIHKKKP